MKAIVLLLIFPFLILAQAPPRFSPLTVSDGLSQGHVNALLKDSDGFMWIGTQDGLNRYDGYEFRTFYHTSGDSTSLANNYIWCLMEDSRGYIWIGTFGGGLCRYDPWTESFRTYYPKPLSGATVAANSIRALHEFPEGTLWVGADLGLYRFDLSTETFHPTGLDTLKIVTALQPLDERVIGIGSTAGLLSINTSTNFIQTIDFQYHKLSNITSILPVERDEFWMAAQTGLHRVRVDEASGRFSSGRPVSGLSGTMINELMLDDNGFLWIAGNNGLSRIDTRTTDPVPVHFRTVADDPRSILSNLVLTLIQVEPGLVWAGTREGISRFSVLDPPFEKLTLADGLCSNSVLGMAEDDRGNLWVATREGLTRVGNFSSSSENWEFECLLPSNTPSMSHDYVLRITPAGDAIWVTFRRNGFAKLTRSATGQWVFQKPEILSRLPSGLGMNGLLEDRQGSLWMATPGAGLVRWDASNNKWRQYQVDKDDPRSLRHDYVFCLLEDHQGTIWNGTANGGLCRYDLQTDDFTCYLSVESDPATLSSNMVLSIFEDSRNRLWVCTAHGLNLMHSDGTFRRFLNRHGLPNEVVYGMLEDDAGYLWVSTNKGLARIDLTEGVFNTDVFDGGDGLQGDEFNQHAFLKTHNGKLLFGGPGGITLFDPARIRPYPHPPPIAITDFQLFNQSVTAGGILDRTVNRSAGVRLRHNQHFIAFEFAALGYTQPENNQYAYMLEGIDEDWVYSGTRRFASYPNLQPGTYVFKVKAANHDGVWNETPRSFDVEIMPPWWRTWWAYLIYILLISTIVLMIIRQRESSIRRLEQAKAEERERFRKRTARDFHDEAGNRITKLALLTEVARRRPSADEKLMEQIQGNIQALRSGMRDFIWVLNPDNDNLHDLLLRLKDFGNEMFQHSPVHFRTEELDHDLKQVTLNGNERRHVLLIFKEAMNNCVKYAGAKQVVLSVEQQPDGLTLTLRDDGIGFDMAAASTGNGLRNMRERSGKLNGVLEIQSQQDRGTSVILHLKPVATI